MKRFSLLLLLCSIAGAAWAQIPPPPPPSPMPFQQHKAIVVAKVQANIAREQRLLACLQAAQDRTAFRACRFAARPVR